MLSRTVSKALANSARNASVTTSTNSIRSYRPSPSTFGCLNARVPMNKQPAAPSQQQIRCASTEHAIANPMLAGIEKRWEAMPPQEQAELWMKLRDRMKADWQEMTLQEKKAAYWIAFGPHGPRAETPKGEGVKIMLQVTKYLLVTAGIYYVLRLFAGSSPKTMTKEWQEASNEYALKEKMDPLTGISSEGYTGKGHVQSPSASAGN